MERRDRETKNGAAFRTIRRQFHERREKTKRKPLSGLTKAFLLGASLLLGSRHLISQTLDKPAGAHLWGDVDGDGAYTVRDAVAILEIAVGTLKPRDVRLSGLPNAPATPAQVKYGRYLVTTNFCADCHGRPLFDNGPPNVSDPHWMAGYVQGLSGGEFKVDSNDYNVFAANLTPDPTTGLGNWTSDQIFTAIRTGKKPDGHYLAPTMPWVRMRNKTDEEIWAIVAYLRSVRPIVNMVQDSVSKATYPDGSADWSSYYKSLPSPDDASPYPAANEVR